MLATSVKTGQHAEDVANHYLNMQGLITLCRNFHGPRGEIDAVMQDGETIVFVEVRYRKQSRFGSGADTITRNKQAKLIATALYYLQKHPKYHNRPARFDVVSISKQDQRNEIDWIKDAFQS